MKNKNILIIGASSGIGAAIADILSQNTLSERGEGVTIYSASRRPNSQLFDMPHITFDVQNPDYQVFTALPDVLHGVVYCPGSINLKPFGRLTADDFKHDFQINVLGAVGVLQAVLPKLKRAEGASIVLFSTVAVQTGMGFHASIAASKGAVEGLTRSLAAELAASKIRVNAIAPSLTDTPLAEKLLSTDEKREASNRRHPLGRFGVAADIANAAVFLLDDTSSWVTGQIMGVDGGLGSLRNV